jgi:hypothetical protein
MFAISSTFVSDEPLSLFSSMILLDFCALVKSFKAFQIPLEFPLFSIVS